MRVVEIYTKGGFQKLVLDSKKEFAKTYGLQAEYWRHFAAEESPEVLSYLKSNLKDLANHYHAQYQRAELAEERPANYREALQWYREFLASFPKDAESPPINYQLADLLLEGKNYGEAAREYERTAYDYPPHEKASAAGYAAIFAHRENLKVAGEEQQPTIKRDAVASSLKFADAFPQHEHAPTVLGAAADDLYEMKDFRPAIAAAQKLIERYPAADLQIRRSAWIVVAHASFDLAEYPQAEGAYTRVLELTPQNDEKRAALVDNLAASIYKQGEQANQLQDYRAAADHFLRIRQAAPTSTDSRRGGIRRCRSAHSPARTGLRRPTCSKRFGARTRSMSCSARRRSRSRSSIGRAGKWRAPPASTSVSRRSPTILSCEARRSSSPAICTSNRRTCNARSPFTSAMSRNFRDRSTSRSKRASRSPRSTRRRMTTRAITKNCRRSSASMRPPALSEQVARGSWRRARRSCWQSFWTTSSKRSSSCSRSRAACRRRSAAWTPLSQRSARLVDYQVGEVTAAATFYMAEVYYGFNRSLIESERPSDLQAADRQEYELALEEEAFPFEERAISVHEKNLELIRAGIYNAWIDKSLAKLAQLMPARYAKSEMSSGFLGSIDSYAYRAPAAPAVGIGAVDGDKATQGDAREPDIASVQDAVDAPQSGAAVTAAGASNAIAH